METHSHSSAEQRRMDAAFLMLGDGGGGGADASQTDLDGVWVGERSSTTAMGQKRMAD